MNSDLADRHLVPGDDEIPDVVFPAIGFEPRFLLALDVFRFEDAIWPPRLAQPVKVDGLGKQLIAILGQAVDIDRFRPANRLPGWWCRQTDIAAVLRPGNGHSSAGTVQPGG